MKKTYLTVIFFNFSALLISADAFGDLADLQARAESGDAAAQYELGLRYIDGDGVEESFEQAAQWYQRAAEQGYASAQLELGLAYDYGDGVEQNSELALEWYRKAAEQNYVPAQYQMGVSYFNGQGVEEDKSEAKKWFGMACEAGDENACEDFQGLEIQGF